MRTLALGWACLLIGFVAGAWWAGRPPAPPDMRPLRRRTRRRIVRWLATGAP